LFAVIPPIMHDSMLDGSGPIFLPYNPVWGVGGELGGMGPRASKTRGSDRTEDLIGMSADHAWLEAYARSLRVEDVDVAPLGGHQAQQH
jgi:hypothetical protein